MRLSEAIHLLDHPALRTIIPATPVCWADLGCGTGLFTEALARFLPGHSAIYGVDLRPGLHSGKVGDVSLIPISADFIRMPLPSEMDGFLMANSLHYVEDKAAFLTKLRAAYRRGADDADGANGANGADGADGVADHGAAKKAPLVIIEYDTDRPVERWVPWPVSFSALQSLLRSAGWKQIERLGEMASVYGGGNIYAALASF